MVGLRVSVPNHNSMIEKPMTAIKLGSRYSLGGKRNGDMQEVICSADYCPSDYHQRGLKLEVPKMQVLISS